MKPSQELFEGIAEKLAVPIAILGAGGAMLALVLGVVALWYYAPGTAGTESGPAMFDHRTDVEQPADHR